MPRRKRQTVLNANPANALQALFAKYRRYGGLEEMDFSDINQRAYGDEDALLHYVARYGGPDELSLVVASGANVNLHGDIGNTALHCASSWGKSDNVTRLLELGADPHAVNEFGETAEHWALTGAEIHPERKAVQLEIAKLLKKAALERAGGPP